MNDLDAARCGENLVDVLAVALDFNRAESNVLAVVFAAMPQGFEVPALNRKGLPDLHVSPRAAREACTCLRRRGYVVKEGSRLLLSDAATGFFADLARELSAKGVAP